MEGLETKGSGKVCFHKRGEHKPECPRKVGRGGRFTLNPVLELF